ncbi:MAG: TIGR03619 family F420-dependent LLM class oxidoreductase [Acidimicrobiales bacterium]
MPDIKFGLFLPPHDYTAALAAAQKAEAQGFYSVSLNDHFVSQDGTADTPQLECFTLLTAIAAQTQRVKIAPSVVAASYRSPALLAKISATLDHVSGGRLIFGVGSGWNVAEYRAHGYEFPDAEERLERLEETLEIVKAMWTQDSPSYTGRYFHIDAASSQPRPLQQPGPPIMLGGSSRKLLEIASRHADIVNLIPPTAHGKDFIKDPDATVRFDRPRLRKRIELLGHLSEDAGRDPAAIERSGFVLANISEDPNHRVFARLAERLGFPDLDSARQSPLALIGTPDQVIEELTERIAQDGVTYFIVVATSPETQELLASEVLPAFA